MGKNAPRELTGNIKIDWSQLELKLVQPCIFPQDGKTENAIREQAKEYAAEAGFDFYALVKPMNGSSLEQGITIKTSELNIGAFTRGWNRSNECTEVMRQWNSPIIPIEFITSVGTAREVLVGSINYYSIKLNSNLEE